MRSLRFIAVAGSLFVLGAFPGRAEAPSAQAPAAPQGWIENLEPIGVADWNPARAAHLLERAGFGATPAEISAFAKLTPAQAVSLVLRKDPGPLPPFEHSGVHDPSLEPFPPSRPATTELARRTGEAIGVKIKPAGNRPLQPVVNRFFYWLRATRLETHRLAYWWANRMLNSGWPLQEKMALFWHGHFAVNETKVRDYRKMLRQLGIFHEFGTGNFRELLIAVSRDPAMLSFLDAGQNVKGAPNENFAREIMELFTLGVGNYSERDIREAARAFTGWNYVDLEYVLNSDQHDSGEKTVLGETGSFGGVEVIDIILAQPACADFIAGKIYQYFAREPLSESYRAQLGAMFRERRYEITPLLRTMFLSKDFYSQPSVGTQIKSPVGLVISTYRKLGLREVPGVPDFNQVTAELGQQLFRPPTVAGWAEGRSWITPALLMARANFAYDALFPDIAFVDPDHAFVRATQIYEVHQKIEQGYDITSATVPEGDGMMAMANQMADRDEDFNTRYGSYRGWQEAIQRVKPTPRSFATVNLTEMVREERLSSPDAVVDYFWQRFVSGPLEPAFRAELIEFLTTELGTRDLGRATSYSEEPLRRTLHLILSAPAYQLG